MIKYIFIWLFLSHYSFGQNLKSFKSEGLIIYYEEYGKGQPLYILTGGPGAPPQDPSSGIIDSLKSKYTCVLLHQRGSGKSRNIPINEKTINIKSYLHDVETLRKLRKDDKIIILGISWGGLLAMNFAAENPDKVSKLLLICSAPPSYKLWNVLPDNQYARYSIAERDSMTLLSKIFSVKTDEQLDSLKRTDPDIKEVRAFKQFVAILHRVHFYDRSKAISGFDKLFADFNFRPIPFIDKEVLGTKWDITKQLKKINTPALIMYGRQDDQGESTFALQKECLKNSEVHVIEKSGHIIWEDQPEQFYKILMDYLNKKKLNTNR